MNNADFRNDGTHGLDVAAIDAQTGIKDVPAYDLGLDLLEHAGNLLLGIGRVLRPLRAEVRQHLGFRGIGSAVAFHLVRDCIGRPQIRLDKRQHFLFKRGVVCRLQLARLLCRLFSQLDDGINHRLEVPVAEHHGTEHDVFAQLFRFRFDHQHRVLGTGDDQIELALRHLVEQRVEHVFVVHEADASCADRTHERRTRQRQRGRGRDHCQNVGIILEIVRQRRYDHLGFVAPTGGEQRSHRAIDQPRDQSLFLGRTALALEIAAGNAARGVELLLVVDRERQEVDAFSRLFGGDHGRQHLRFAVSGDDCAVGLARDLAGL